MPHRRIIYALDFPTLAEARAGAERVRDDVGVLKIGLELFVKEGPAALGLGAALGLETFADLKLHDIPETVDRAVASAAAVAAFAVDMFVKVERQRAAAVEQLVVAPLQIEAVGGRQFGRQRGDVCGEPRRHQCLVGNHLCRIGRDHADIG